MIFSLFGDHSLKVPTKARLVDDGDSEALRRKLESVEWKPAPDDPEERSGGLELSQRCRIGVLIVPAAGESRLELRRELAHQRHAEFDGVHITLRQVA